MPPENPTMTERWSETKAVIPAEEYRNLQTEIARLARENDALRKQLQEAGLIPVEAPKAS